MTRPGVVLFTRDLRAHDQPALAAARRECSEVVPLFVLDDRLLAVSPRRTKLLLAQLDRLRDAIGLLVVEGDPVEEVARLAPGAVWRAWRARPLPAPARSGRRLSEPSAPLSARLHLGIASPAEVARGAGEELLRKLCWRDFFAQLLAAEPELEWRDMHPGRRTWRDDPDAVAAWREGRTGVSFVDAAMRQLLAEGFMPNRQRLVVSSYLTKELGTDWRIGAAHFMAHFVDGDVASNSGNWQWVAGTGADTRPNRRIDPERQARLHDPAGDYVRRWLPERFANR